MADKPILIDLNDIKNRKVIIISASQSQLQAIEKILDPQDITLKSLDKNVYELTLKSTRILLPTVVEDIGIDHLGGQGEEETVELLDFKNSSDFYLGAKKRNSYKIISDEFSDMRNRELYKSFQLIERRWRHTVSSWHAKHDKTLTTHNSKIADHAVSTYGLAEFYEQFLYAPASEDYMRKTWLESAEQDVDVVIRIANLKLLDELGINLSVNELELIRVARNACMHSRVITPKEYTETTRLINKYIIDEVRKEFSTKIMASISELQERFMTSLMAATESMRLFQEKISKVGWYKGSSNDVV